MSPALDQRSDRDAAGAMEHLRPLHLDISPADSQEAAFADLFRSEHRRVYALALRMLGEAQSAEDIVQDGFLSAWRSWSSFRGESTRASWIYGIVLRSALSELRNTKRRNVLVLPDSDAVDRAVSHDPSAELGLDLEGALALLPERPRAVFVLRDIEGFSTNDVADLLQISSGTVKAHLFTARRRLAAHLIAYD